RNPPFTGNPTPLLPKKARLQGAPFDQPRCTDPKARSRRSTDHFRSRETWRRLIRLVSDAGGPPPERKGNDRAHPCHPILLVTSSSNHSCCPVDVGTSSWCGLSAMECSRAKGSQRSSKVDTVVVVEPLQPDAPGLEREKLGELKVEPR